MGRRSEIVERSERDQGQAPSACKERPYPGRELRDGRPSLPPALALSCLCCGIHGSGHPPIGNARRAHGLRRGTAIRSSQAGYM